MLKPEKCPSCGAYDDIINITYALCTIIYSEKKCNSWWCRWRCKDCSHNRKTYKKWWCNNCNYNFDDDEAGISTMWIKMKSGECKHFEVRN